MDGIEFCHAGGDLSWTAGGLKFRASVNINPDHRLMTCAAAMDMPPAGMPTVMGEGGPPAAPPGPPPSGKLGDGKIIERILSMLEKWGPLILPLLLALFGAKNVAAAYALYTQMKAESKPAA